MTNTLLAQLVTDAAAKAEISQFQSGMATATTEHGEVVCYVDLTDKHYRKAQHFKTTWRLNGKVISRASLETVLNTVSAPVE